MCENLAGGSAIEALRQAADEAACTLGYFLCGYFLKALSTGNNLSNAYDCFLLRGPARSASES